MGVAKRCANKHTWGDRHRLPLEAQQQEGAVDGEAGDELLRGLRVRRGAHYNFSASECTEGFCLVDLRTVDVFVRTEIARELFLRGAGRECDNAESHRLRDLNSEVTQAAVPVFRNRRGRCRSGRAHPMPCTAT